MSQDKNLQKTTRLFQRAIRDKRNSFLYQYNFFFGRLNKRIVIHEIILHMANKKRSNSIFPIMN